MHIVRLGKANEQSALNAIVAQNDTLLFKANLVAHMPGGLSAFLYSFSRTPNYLMDPYVYAFQQNVAQFYSDKNDALKRSVKKLLSAYGEPLASRVEARQAVVPGDFRGDLDDFIRRVVGFQENKLSVAGTDLEPFFDFLGLPLTVPPKFVVAPSFSLHRGTVSEWLAVNRRLAERTCTLFPQREVFGQLIVDDDVMYAKEMREIVSAYNDLPVSGILLWIGGFSEHEASLPELRHYLRTLKSLKKPKVNMFGSYFSVVLARFAEEVGILGVAHGAGYGEDREVDPATGGMPVAKYYVPALHRRYNYETAAQGIVPFLRTKEMYYKHVCSCPTCHELVENMGPEAGFSKFGQFRLTLYKRQGEDIFLQVPEAESQTLAVSHYLHVKEREYHDEGSLEGVLDSLDSAEQQFREHFGPENLRHLGNWLRVLRGQ